MRQQCGHTYARVGKNTRDVKEQYQKEETECEKKNNSLVT